MPLPISKAIIEKTVAWARRAEERLAHVKQWCGYTIRYANYSDVSELLKLHEEHDYQYAFKRDRAYLQQMVAQSYQDIPKIGAGFLVFEDNMSRGSPIIGMRVFSTKSDLGWLESGAIHLHGSKLKPSCQNRGLMGQLSKHVFARIFEKNPSVKIEVGVVATNKQSIASLKKMGFIFKSEYHFDPATVPKGLTVPDGVQAGDLENTFYLSKTAFEAANTGSQ